MALSTFLLLALVARSHALLELLEHSHKPGDIYGQTPPRHEGTWADMQMGAGRPLGPQSPQEPAAAGAPRPMVAGNPANPAAPATNLQGALRMSMGSLMGFCRCEGLSLPAARSASPDPPPPFAFVTSPATPHIHGGAP